MGTYKIDTASRKEGLAMPEKKKVMRVRMVVIKPDGEKSIVPPFNRDTQEIREKEAKNFGFLHALRI